MAHYDIFREQLETRYPAYGHALWEPRPGSLYSPVEVGDVGYIREGAFHRLFNALLAADHPSHGKFGVPEYHVPLVPTPPDHINIGTLNPTHYCSHGITVTTAEPDFHATPDDLPQVSYQFTRKNRGGAVSFLPTPAQRQDTIARGAFGRWMIKHIELWLDFTRRLGLGIEQMEDIILITGCHRTRSWANVAFLESHTDSQVAFGVEVTDPGGPSMNIIWRFSPERVQGAVLSLGPSGKNLPEDQCIFIRGFRVTRTLRILPKHLIAAAEPSSDSDEHSNDPDIELTSIPNITEYRDPLRILLEHLAERVPDCDMVLVHDDDLARIAGIYDSDETFQTDTAVCLLRQSQPEIQQVQCDLLCIGESSSTTTAEATTVAMSSAEFQAWGEPCISRNSKGHSKVRNPLSQNVQPPTLQPELPPSNPPFSAPLIRVYRQRPTLQNARIRTTQDALQVFFAVARNVLTLLTRRPDTDERKAIRSGNVYIWEERSASTVDNGGLVMERWTDGMSWGAARAREGFLFYFQRDPAQGRIPSGGGRMSSPLQDNDKLIKQTYSVYVFLPEDKGQDITRKWHLTAYFNQSTLDDLALIDDIPDIGRIPIPEGLFKSTRTTKSRRDDPRPSTLGMPTGPRSSASHFHPSSVGSVHHSPPLQAPPRSGQVPAAPGKHPSTWPPSLAPLETLGSCHNATDQRMNQQLSVSSSVDPGSRSPIGTSGYPYPDLMTPYNDF